MVVHNAKNVEIAGNSFDYGSLVDIAPVNAWRILIHHNFFGPRGGCVAGAFIDVEPNHPFDIASGITIDHNDMDIRGTQCDRATAFGGISLGSNSGRPEHVLIDNNRFRGATAGPGTYAGGNLTRNAFQMQQAVHVWQARDTTISNNHVEGYYNNAFEFIGDGPTDRITISDNKLFGDGNITRLLNTRYSVISGNVYQHRGWFGNVQSQPFVTMSESAGSGFNIYKGNIGVSRYDLDPTSTLRQ
jgi:hypothetical protein